MNNDWIQWGPNCRVRASEIVGVYQETRMGSYWSHSYVIISLSSGKEYTMTAGSWEHKGFKEQPANVVAEVERLMDLATDGHIAQE